MSERVGNNPIVNNGQAPVSTSMPFSSSISAVKNTFQGTPSKLASLISGSTGRNLMILVIALLVAGTVAGILYFIITHYLSTHLSYIVPESKSPIICKTTTVLDASKLPQPDNGIRYAFSFWIYIYDINYLQGQFKHVLHISNNISDDVDEGCPYVILDKMNNKLYISLSPNSSRNLYLADNNEKIDIDSSDVEGKVNLCSALRGITVDYIPLQRWVHITTVFNEQINGGTVYSYVDGELVKTVDTSNPTIVNYIPSSGSSDNSSMLPNQDACPASVVAGSSLGITDRSNALNASVTLNIVNTKLVNGGKIFIGGSTTDGTQYPGFSGLVSSIKFYNSDINASDVYNEYLKGPIDNVFSKAGLPAYGLQSPVYKIT